MEKKVSSAKVRIPSRVLLVFVFLLSIVGCGMRGKESKTEGLAGDGDRLIAFYNVENLFDTIDDPLKMDEDFTPEGKLQWNTVRYSKKLVDLTKVVMQMQDGRGPDILGLCEIENRLVLEDLIEELRSKGRSFEIVHRDSPDERGIDVALLYDPASFTLQSSSWLPVKLDDPADPNTRDILYATGRLNGELSHLFVNHWPSRGKGQAESEKDRVMAASVIRKQIEEVLRKDPTANIICMGDFNDYPSDKSIHDILGAGKSNEESLLYNLMGTMDESGQGSYNYKGDWGTLDQFMVSRSMLDDRGLKVSEGDALIWKLDWMLFTKNDGTQIPNKTYAGSNYTGGYSDHLPVGLMIHSQR